MPYEPNSVLIIQHWPSGHVVEVHIPDEGIDIFQRVAELDKLLLDMKQFIGWHTVTSRVMGKKE